jgi:dihydrofolate reductase
LILSIIVAASENNAIGKDGQLLWHLPNDLKFFKNTTWGMPVIMGRNTFESVGKILPGRFNIVMTSNSQWEKTGVIKVASIDDALEEAQKTGCKELFIAGGGVVYKNCLSLADKIYMTRVHAQLEGDTFFPEIAADQWQLTMQEDFPADEKHAYAYSFQVWEKK